ncbi:MAG: hypothetical protein ACOY46_00400 [Bacillota bacterium]
MDNKENFILTPLKGERKLENTYIGTHKADLKTIVLWIYNINQNGAANTFHEDVSQYFTRGADGNVLLRDMTPEMLSDFLLNISTAKEIELHDLGIRLVLLIYNCNQNGVHNTARVACEEDLRESDTEPEM